MIAAGLSTSRSTPPQVFKKPLWKSWLFHKGPMPRRRYGIAIPFGCEATPAPSPALRDHPLPQGGEGSDFESALALVARHQDRRTFGRGDRGAGGEGVLIAGGMVIT